MAKSLKNLIIFPSIGIIVLLIVFFTIFTLFSVTGSSDGIAEDSARVASRGIRAYIDDFRQDTTATTSIVAGDPNFIQLVQSGSHSELLAFLNHYKALVDIDFFVVHDNEGRVLVRTHYPDQYGDIISTPKLDAALDGRAISNFTSGETTPLIYSTTALIHYSDEFIGLLIAGLHISEPTFLHRMRQIYNIELTFFYGDRAVASTFPEFDGENEVFADADIAAIVLQDGHEIIRHQRIGDIDYAVKYYPLLDSDGETIGMISTAFSKEPLRIALSELLRGYIIIGIMGTTISIIILIGIVTIVSKPLLEANERVRILFDSSPMAIYLYDTNKKALDCNIKAQELFGYPNKKAALEQSPDTMMPTQPNGEESYAALDAHLKKALELGVHSTEFFLQKLDGTPLPVEIIFIRIKHNGADAIAEYVLDLRKQKEAEEKNLEAQRLNQIILDSAPLVISLRNSKNEVIRANKRALEIFDFENQQQYIDNWHLLSPEFQPCGTSSRERINAVLAEALQTGKANFEWMYQLEKNGELLPMDVTLVKFNHQGEEMMVGYSFDLRPIKQATQLASEYEWQAELARRETVAKTRFLAQISHEIRTPMNAVLGIAEIQLQKENLSKDLKESLTHIRNSSYLLLAIINNLLDISKAEAGKLEISERSYETISLIVDSVQLNMFYMGSKRIEFSVKVKENLPFSLVGDDLRIKQILNNLLSNAFKYTSKGSVELSFDVIRSELAPPDEISLEICVKDSGRGMSQSQIYRLFGEEYLRFDEDESIEGSGLGMIITYQLVKMMGGKIKVASEPNKGTEVTIRLPQKTADDNIIGEEFARKLQNFEFAQMTKYQAADFARVPMPYGRVLVVDDVELNLYVAKGHLTPYELNIDMAMSGFEAIDKINSGEIYDIIFMDHMMPEMDGMETVKKLRDDGYDRTIVALTANALVGNDKVFLQHGFDDFISKPINIRDLNQVLNKYIRDAHPEEAAKYKGVIRGENVAAMSEDVEATGTAISPKMIDVFRRDAENAITTIREASASGNLKLFSTSAHAMKSALAYIGENELSDDAAKLEVAGKTGDMDYIDSNAAQFIESLEYLLNKLQHTQSKSYDELDVFEDMAYLAKRLKVVETACLDYNVKSAVLEIEALLEKAWKKDISDRLCKMRDLLFLESDFDTVLEILNSFL